MPANNFFLEFVRDGPSPAKSTSTPTEEKAESNSADKQATEDDTAAEKPRETEADSQASSS